MSNYDVYKTNADLYGRWCFITLFQTLCINKKALLEDEITYSFNEVSDFIFNFENNHNQSGSKCTQNMYRNTG